MVLQQKNADQSTPNASETRPAASSRSRHTVSALISAAALTALATITAPPTIAADQPGIAWDHTWSGVGVKVYVEEYGDIISVCDASANGHSAWVTVDDISANITGYRLTANRGTGTCSTHRAGDGGRYNLREDHRIALNFEGSGGRGSYYVSYLNDH